MNESESQESKEGLTIPVPTKKGVLADLRKVARKHVPPEDSDASASGPEDEQGEHRGS